MKINMNKVAVIVAAAESGKQELSIAQIKEVMKCFVNCLKSFKRSEVLELLERE